MIGHCRDFVYFRLPGRPLLQLVFVWKNYIIASIHQDLFDHNKVHRPVSEAGPDLQEEGNLRQIHHQ